MNFLSLFKPKPPKQSMAISFISLPTVKMPHYDDVYISARFVVEKFSDDSVYVRLERYGYHGVCTDTESRWFDKLDCDVLYKWYDEYVEKIKQWWIKLYEDSEREREESRLQTERNVAYRESLKACEDNIKDRYDKS